MIVLPYSSDRTWLMSFWWAVSLITGLMVGTLATLIISKQWAVMGVIVAPLLILVGQSFPQLISKIYKLWNRVARLLARQISLYLMSICFYIVFVVVGRTNSTLKLTHPSINESLWIPLEKEESVEQPSQIGAERLKLPPKGWISAFLTWAVQSRNLWAVCLLPFLILLRKVEFKQKANFPSSIYTLY